MGDMNEITPDGWWELLPAGIREQVDGYVLQDSRMQAVRLVRQACRARGIGLHDAELVVHERFVHHGDRVARTPESPLDVESLAALASGCPGRVVAVEAVWDGDTVHDWFTVLLALTAGPAGEHHLATLHRGTAVRYLGEGASAGGRHPSAAAAARAGRALAERLGVPFHFAGPDTPGSDVKRS
ncbi:hypothetical protein ABZ924_32870 [Streptomyces sp. NPDC046876]|uniref:hypothetical protein n=1 Tax=Streptomyces sp. NPDC046876 TaxID=3155616 RepID=UPI0033C6E552